MPRALCAAILVLALAACQAPRHCSLVDLDWCDPRNPQLPEKKETVAVSVSVCDPTIRR